MSSAGLPTTPLASPVERWEYQVLHFDARGLFGPNLDIEQLQIRLNAAGNAGWELVAVSDLNAGRGATDQLLAILKRRVIG
jgi:Domain of unknown function (DUF4177)